MGEGLAWLVIGTFGMLASGVFLTVCGHALDPSYNVSFGPVALAGAAIGEVLCVIAAIATLARKGR